MMKGGEWFKWFNSAPLEVHESLVSIDCKRWVSDSRNLRNQTKRPEVWK